MFEINQMRLKIKKNTYDDQSKMSQTKITFAQNFQLKFNVFSFIYNNLFCLFLISFLTYCTNFSFFQLCLCQEFNSNFELYSNDPDITRNSTEILESYGFQTEIHQPITEDGYILTIIRIINPYINSSFNGYNNTNLNNKSLPSVLMQHGLMCNSNFWLLSRPTQLLPTGEYINENGTVTDCSGQHSETVSTSLAMVLAACGYDVWLGNFRGNRYSYGHILFNSNIDSNYWAFSIDELSRFDLTSEILYILTTTKQSQLAYIGHSLGTTAMFQLLSTRPEYSDFIRPFVALAPVAHVGSIQAPIFQIGAHTPSIFEYITTAKAPLFIIPSPEWGLSLPKFGRYFCGNSFFKPLCTLFLFSICGFDPINTDERLIPQTFGHFPDDTSTQVLGHFAQRVVRNDFRQFDYGAIENLKLYGSIQPASYNLSMIQNQYIILISSIGDWLADSKDVDYLRSQLSVRPWADYLVSLQKFNHFDFSIGKDVGVEVNARVLRDFKQIFN